MSRNPLYQFVDTDTTKLEAALVDAYEAIVGHSAQPSSPERIFIAWVASIILQERVYLNHAGNQNIPSRAEGANLDALGELFYQHTRPAATSSTVTMRFNISEAQTSAVLIPKGTRVSNGQNKRYQDCVLEYTNLLEDNLIDAVNRLQWHEYQTGPLHQFYEYYPKKRIISSLPFYDRVVNCAAYNVTWPIYSKSFYEHSYGSVPGKGPVRCANTIQGWMREAAAKPGDWYFVKMDITKFFFRIPTEVQLRELGRPLDDADMMWFFERAIRCDGRPLGLPLHCTDVTTAERIAGRGMQVGSLVSQMTANVVMTPADHYIKRELCAPYYARYMDDMGAIIEGKAAAWELVEEVDNYLQTNLGLNLNQKTAVIPIGNPVEFVGRKISPVKIELRRQTTLGMKKHLRYVQDAYAAGEIDLDYALSVITSYRGLFKDVTSDAFLEKMLDEFVLSRPALEA